jgi:hypothetical protein
MNRTSRVLIGAAVGAVATLTACVSANAGGTADFKQSFDTVLCKGNSQVEWESPDAGLFKPKDKQVIVMITTTREGWALSGEYGFEIKRWSRNTKDGFPAGSVGWDDEGIWAHWLLLFGDNGHVFMEQHSRQGVQLVFLNCEYALGPPR